MKNCTGNGFYGRLSGVVTRRDAVKFRCLFLIFLITLVTCSAYVVSFHYNNGPVIRTDCPTCKFMAVLSSWEDAAAMQPVIPDCVRVSFYPEGLLFVFGTMTLVLGTRAPPFCSPLSV